MISRRPTVADIQPDEAVVFYPSVGYQVNGGRSWRVLIRGSVFVEGGLSLRQRLLIRMLGRLMRATPQAMQSELFHERIRPFTVSPERGKQLAVRVGDQTFQLQGKSKRNGHFSGVVRLPAEYVDQLRGAGQCVSDQLQFSLLTGPGDDREFAGRAHLTPSEGVSVISDIDDTMKHTCVTSRRALLANTFLREFSSIDGMAELYDSWSARGWAFHYVSSSPWQLYAALAEMCDVGGFPAGTFHLRNFRLRDHMLRRLLRFRRSGKSVIIETLLTTFPGRRFVLVGDSGERDPEIYADIARRFPHQVQLIAIRNLDERPVSESRFRKTFRGVPADQIRLFNAAGQLQDALV